MLVRVFLAFQAIMLLMSVAPGDAEAVPRH